MPQFDRLATHESAALFEHIFNAEGLEPAIRHLNASVPHRFTTLFRLQDRVYIPICLIDKQGRFSAGDQEPIDFSGSFCEISLALGSFVTIDSRIDVRAQASPLKELVRSYMGLPLATPEGIWGSICHYDFCIQSMIDSAQLNLLKAAAEVLVRRTAELESGMPAAAPLVA